MLSCSLGSYPPRLASILLIVAIKGIAYRQGQAAKVHPIVTLKGCSGSERKPSMRALHSFSFRIDLAKVRSDAPYTFSYKPDKKRFRMTGTYEITLCTPGSSKLTVCS